MFDLPGIAIPTLYMKKFGTKRAVAMCSIVIGVYDASVLGQDLQRTVRKFLFKKISNPDEIKNFILKNKGSFKCEWCGTYCHSLHEHHYPVPACKGGKDKVKICGTCPANYHFIEQTGVPNRRFVALKKFVLKNSTKGYINE